ncbi:MAG: hypothetical protein K0R76_241 [Alphaproteobacteria bacterium]|jgi:TPR repeat protein|nr:hypothetical protein [Alphaproteobacteria bacterium]
MTTLKLLTSSTLVAITFLVPLVIHGMDGSAGDHAAAQADPPGGPRLIPDDRKAELARQLAEANAIEDAGLLPPVRSRCSVIPKKRIALTGMGVMGLLALTKASGWSEGVRPQILSQQDTPFDASERWFWQESSNGEEINRCGIGKWLTPSLCQANRDAEATIATLSSQLAGIKKEKEEEARESEATIEILSSQLAGIKKEKEEETRASEKTIETLSSQLAGIKEEKEEAARESEETIETLSSQLAEMKKEREEEARKYYDLASKDYYNYGHAKKLYEKAASLEHTEALNRLGDFYYVGLGVPVNREKAKECWERAAAQGNAFAQGILSYHGLGGLPGYEKAREWFETAAAQGDSWAQNRLGSMYAEGRFGAVDYAQAKEWFETAAAQGDSWAQYNLGRIYHYGKGGKQDYAQAKEWYEKAAAQGNPNAQNNLGILHMDGLGVKKDYEKARGYYEEAADQGYSWAQYNLGNIYFEGRGVSKNYAEAKRYFEKAATQGHAAAQSALDKLQPYLKEEQKI